MNKVLRLNLSNGLNAIVKGDQEKLDSVISFIENANASQGGDVFLDVDLLQGLSGKVSAYAVIGYNIMDENLLR